MEFNISKNALQKELGFVQGIVERKNTIPALSNILIESIGENAIRMVGSEPFLFSSDFPHEVNNAYCRAEIDEILEHEALTPADREAILHANAERFYGL